jgi:hypothetical protein
MNLVNAISESKASIHAKYLREGKYLLQVHNAKTSMNRNKVPTIVFEFLILDSTNETEHPIGSYATLLYFGDNPSGLKGAKTALCRILGVDECDLTSDMIYNSLNPAEGKRFSPLRGIKVEASVKVIPTKRQGRFTQTTLYTVDQDADSICTEPSKA